MFLLTFCKSLFCSVEQPVDSIDKSLLQKIIKLQITAANLEANDLMNTECCVCFEEEIKRMPLECAHSLCAECHEELLKRNYTNCPLCLQPMVLVNAHKFYAIMAPSRHMIHITYLPPIYDERKNKWLDSEFLCAASADFVLACDAIKKNNYVVVRDIPSITS